MTYAFDTLGYAKRLRNAGIASEQAEAHAEAAREFVMGELVTRYDLERAQRETDSSIAAVRQEIVLLATRTEAAIGSLRQELERATLQMTVRLGGMIAIAVAVLAALIKL